MRLSRTLAHPSVSHPRCYGLVHYFEAVIRHLDRPYARVTATSDDAALTFHDIRTWHDPMPFSQPRASLPTLSSCSQHLDARKSYPTQGQIFGLGLRDPPSPPERNTTLCHAQMAQLIQYQSYTMAHAHKPRYLTGSTPRAQRHQAHPCLHSRSDLYIPQSP